MRISDWSSDVCSSDLVPDIIGSKGVAKEALKQGGTAVIVLDSREKLKGISNSESAYAAGQGINAYGFSAAVTDQVTTLAEIGRASCRERVCQYVSISVVAVSLKKKKKPNKKKI